MNENININVANGCDKSFITKCRMVMESFKKFPQYGIVIVFCLMFIILSVSTEAFFSYGNILNVLRQASAQMIVAVGMTFVLILGGIDLSVGSVACLAGTLAAGFMVHNHLNTPFAILLSLVIGILVGLINGLVVAEFKIPAFIATLAMMSTARGASLIYSGGYPISGIPDDAMFIGRGYLLGIPIPVIVMLVIIAIAWIVLTTTKFGRYVYAIGGNEEAARLSGVKVNLLKISVYALSGLTASMTGVLLTTRLASSQPTLGQGMELDAIAAVVLGGTSLFGGRGYIFGTVIGGLFLAVLRNGLNILGVSSFWQMAVTGVILVMAVSLYERRR